MANEIIAEYDTTLWDCELVGDVVIFTAECDEEHCKNFMDSIKRFYPGISKFIQILKES